MLQVGRGAGRSVGLEIGRRRHGNAAYLPDAFCDQSRIGDFSDPNRKIDSLFGKIREAVAHDEIDGHVRVAVQERRQPRHDVQAAKYDRRCYPQLARRLAATAADRILCLAKRLEGAQSVVIERTTVIREGQCPGSSGQQARAKMIFKGGNLPADGWLGRVQLLRDGCETAGVNHPNKRPHRPNKVHCHSYVGYMNDMKPVRIMQSPKLDHPPRTVVADTAFMNRGETTMSDLSNAISRPAYFSKFAHLRMTRDAAGVLLVEMHTNGGPILFDATDHEQFVDAFYEIGRDRSNKVVILTGIGDYMAEINFGSFGNVGDANVWSKVHDEGTQILENIANIRVPFIAAIEGRAHIHTEYALLANVVVAGQSVTFHDLPHFAGGIVPGDGIFTTWSYRAGAGRAESFLFNPEPVPAQTAADWGVVTHIVEDGQAVAKARSLAAIYLRQPEATRRNTRIHFVQPLKERIVREVGYGLALEGASASALVQQMTAKAV